MIRTFALMCLMTAAANCTAGPDRTVLIDNGKARAVIVVSPRVMADKNKIDRNDHLARELEDQRVALRESVRDLAHYFRKMSGGEVPIVTELPPADDPRLPILVGEMAAGVEPPSTHVHFDQAFRIVVEPNRVALVGESDRAVSYAIYEILHNLGCRWYIPSEMGEVIPELKTIALPVQDVSSGPYTIVRGLWYGDADFKRRNRCGGLVLAAGHALENYVSKEQLEAHPEWVATVDGKPNPHRLKMSAPGLADAIADNLVQSIEKRNMYTVSLSTADGMGYDNSPEDRALDAGDFDPSFGDVSHTDRFLWFFNQIADKVTAKHPDVLLGMLAYAVNTRPPVREKVHPNIIPQIAPITFSRAHPMTDDGEPNNAALRYLVEGWGKAARMTSYYFYAYFLAEISAPNPMITKWSVDIPIVYEKGNCRFWQPETTANYESSMHALYLGTRMAWDPSQDPAAIIDELHEKFYGHAAEAMAAYWHYIDRVWVDTPEYAGAGFGHLRRWTPEHLGQARKLLDAGKAAAVTPEEKFRVQMADDSLSLFEDFMKLRRDLAEGRWSDLETGATAYRQRTAELGVQYAPQASFGKMSWTRNDTVHGRYFGAFYQKTYVDAARLARETDLLTEPLRQWRYKADEEEGGQSQQWQAVDFDDAAWATTDVAVDTWSALDLHNYMGAMWYRRQVEIPAEASGRDVYLWIGATDGSAKVFVNGTHVPYVNDKGESVEKFVGYCKPASFNITSALKPGQTNTIAIFAKREFMNELGTGGLLAPVTIYATRDE